MKMRVRAPFNGARYQLGAGKQSMLTCVFPWATRAIILGQAYQSMCLLERSAVSHWFGVGMSLPSGAGSDQFVAGVRGFSPHIPWLLSQTPRGALN